MKIGSHVGNSGILMLKGSVLEALSYNATCFMVYMGAPQNTFRKPLHMMNIEDFKDILEGHDLNIEDVIVHAPYIVNLGQIDEEKHNFGVRFLIDEIRKIEVCGMKYMVLHPGAYVKATLEQGLNQIIKGVNLILANTSSVTILLETMAGKGSELGGRFEELKAILDGIGSEQVGVCLDTCHVSDAGYDILGDLDGVLRDFDRVIGIDRLRAIHLNDSMNPPSAHKDRHAKIGEGHIGTDAIVRVINHPLLCHLPFYLETPHDTNDGYAKEIAMLRAAYTHA